MGIGNTASAALVSAKVLGSAVADLTGRGTGLDDAGLAVIIAAGVCAHRAKLAAADALREYGGFEIAMMAGAMLGAAGTGRPIIVDGFICSAAALCQNLSATIEQHLMLPMFPRSKAIARCLRL